MINNTFLYMHAVITVVGIESEVSETNSSVEICVKITNGTIEDGSPYIYYSTYSEGSATGR